MFSRIREDLSKVPRYLRIASFISIILMGGGIASNAIVMYANGGRMPVAMQKEDIFFVIGPAQYGVKFFPIFEDFDDGHGPLLKETNFRLLGDRIPISFKFIHPNKLPRWCYGILNYMGIPAGGDGIASVGDLLMWPGMLLAIPIIPILSIYLVVGIFRKFKRKK